MKRILVFAASISVAICSVAFGARSSAQTSLQWQAGQPFDNGIESAVAVLQSGLVVEVHQSAKDHSYWYHCGQLQKDRTTWSIEWGESHRIDAFDGSAASIAISKAGYIVFVHSRYDELSYWVGHLSPVGGPQQTIDWMVQGYHYDSGYRPNVAITAEGRLIEVHESPQGGGNRLFSRLGEFSNTADGDFHINWISGKNGLRYDRGVLPHIAVNDQFQVVEVHQVNSEQLLHYHRGSVTDTYLGMWPSVRYDSNGGQAAVALANSGLAIEVHTSASRVYSRLGTLPQDASGLIEWSTSTEIGWPGFSAGSPSVATDGQVAVATWESKGALFWSAANLR